MKNLSEKTLKRLAIGSAIVAVCVVIFGFNYIDKATVTKKEAAERLNESIEERRAGENMRFEYLYGEE